jgi:hypothetical protein
MSWLNRLLGRPTADDFAQMMLQQLHADGTGADFRYDRGGFALIDGDRGNRFNLANAYQDYLRAPRRERAAVLRKYAAVGAPPEIPADFAAARAHLMPAIRSRTYISCTALALGAGGADVEARSAARALGTDRVVTLAFDSTDMMALLDRKQLDQWGVSADEAFAAAFGNLRDRTTDQFLRIGEALYVGQWGDSYDCSRVLLPDVIARLNLPGAPVALIVARGDLLVTSERNEAAQLAALALAEERLDQNQRWCAGSWLRLQGREWHDYLPTSEAVRGRTHALSARIRASDYQWQKSELDKLNERNGTELFVASYTLVQSNGDGALQSYAVWSRGVPTLLPETDLIAFFDPDVGDKKLQSWMVERERAWPHLAALAETQPYFPPRHLVRDFPDAETCERLRALAQ